MNFLINNFQTKLLCFDFESAFTPKENSLIRKLIDIIFNTYQGNASQIDLKRVRDILIKINTFPNAQAMVIAGQLCLEIIKSTIQPQLSVTDIPEFYRKKNFIFYVNAFDEFDEFPSKYLSISQIEVEGIVLDAICRDFIFFKQLIKGNFREASQSEIILKIINVKQMSALIKFYTTGINSLKLSELNKLIELCKITANFELAEVLEKYLKGTSKLTPEELYRFCYLCKETHNPYIAKQELNKLFKNIQETSWNNLKHALIHTISMQTLISITCDYYPSQFSDNELKFFLKQENQKGFFESITINNHPNLSNVTLQEIAQLSGLKSIHLNNLKKIDDLGISAFADCKMLSSISINNCNLTDEGILNLAVNNHIRSIQLLNLMKITDVSLIALTKNVKLQDFSIRGCSLIEDTSLVALSKLPSLRWLDIGHCRRITNVGIKEIVNKTHLYSLNMDSCDVTTEDIIELTKNMWIQSLSLMSIQISHEAMKAIAKLPFLQKLNLSKSSLTEKCFVELSNSKSLQSLELEFCNVSDSHIYTLAKIPTLKCLSLAGCREVTNQSVLYLTNREGFQAINLYACNKISNECILELRSRRIMVDVV